MDQKQLLKGKVLEFHRTAKKSHAFKTSTESWEQRETHTEMWLCEMSHYKTRDISNARERLKN